MNRHETAEYFVKTAAQAPRKTPLELEMMRSRPERYEAQRERFRRKGGQLREKRMQSMIEQGRREKAKKLERSKKVFAPSQSGGRGKIKRISPERVEAMKYFRAAEKKKDPFVRKTKPAAGGGAGKSGRTAKDVAKTVSKKPLGWKAKAALAGIGLGAAGIGYGLSK